MTALRKRLIEVAFPLEEVSEHSRREKKVKQGHINMLHVWWARRPLAACRAFIYASLVDDPIDDEEREHLLREVADIASWDVVRHPGNVVRTREQGGSGLTGRELIGRARDRILESNGGERPRLRDPFAGGGAIPLEALRLGCDVEASDLNPVAALILKGTVEYPQLYGQANSREVPTYIHEAQQRRQTGQSAFFDGDLVQAYRANPLATDVRYWGNWILEKAREQLREFYPADLDGNIPVAYLWSRTVVCPSCGGTTPLFRQFWLAKKANKRIAIEPIPIRSEQRVEFRILEGDAIVANPSDATTLRGDTKCLLCNQPMKAEEIQRAGVAGLLGELMTSVVVETPDAGKAYRIASSEDRFRYAKAQAALKDALPFRELPPIPDEPVARDPRNIWCYKYGLDEFGKLFNDRQLLCLTTFAHLVESARLEMTSLALEPDYADALSLYLAFVLDRLANTNSTLARLMSAGGRGIVGTFARQALPMVWDYAEANPFGTSASWTSAVEGIVTVLTTALAPDPSSAIARVSLADARDGGSSRSALVLTDPPYYDAINYAALSDFFYVWLKRSLGAVFPSMFTLPLTPKKTQIVMDVYVDPDVPTTREDARKRYVDGMSESFNAVSRGLIGVVFANTDSDAWGTLIEGLLDAQLVPQASWPIDTELEDKVAGMGQARLKTSVWMACTPRKQDVGDAFIADLMAEMRPVIRERLLYFWSKGIRGADFFISAIGPALSVFGKYSKVMRPDGSEVAVRDFLEIVRRESTHVALEQVLQGADLGVVDSITQQFVTWVWSTSRAPLDAGEAIALCLATGADYGEVVRSGSIALEVREKSKKLVKLRTIKERGENDEELGLNQPARPAPLIDQLQRAAWLWGRNRVDELGSFRAALGESRWMALRTLGNAVAGCLPDGDDDKRLILGVLSSSAMGIAPPRVTDPSSADGRRVKQPTAGATLPGFGDGGSDGD